jgi:hypothetical protein
MAQECEFYVKPCHCPTANNKYGHLENFHTSADEITNAILSAVIVLNEEKEI